MVTSVGWWGGDDQIVFLRDVSTLSFYGAVECYHQGGFSHYCMYMVKRRTVWDSNPGIISRLLVGLFKFFNDLGLLACSF